MYVYISPRPAAKTGTLQIIALFISHTCAPFFQRANLNHSDLKAFWQNVLHCTESRVYLIINGPPCWQTGPDGCLNKLTRLLIFLRFLLQSLLHFENSDMGWGAAHTQECRWVKTGSNTHAREVSFHPLAVVRWGGQHQTNMGAIWLPPRQRHALPSS